MASFYFFDSLSSTMDEARAMAFQGGKEGDVIIAKHQTKGRGRRGRVWESLPGNLHLTYLTYLDIPLNQAPQLSLVACVALGEELLNWIPPSHNLTYKWPNDHLLNRKKVGGLLLEAIPHPEKKEVCYLIGFGLNLKCFPQEVRYPATSFEAEGIYVSLESIQKTLVISLEYYLRLWREKGFDFIYDLWMKRAAYLDTSLSVEIGDKVEQGIFKGIDKEGSLLLKTSGRILKISVGEVL